MSLLAAAAGVAVLAGALLQLLLTVCGTLLVRRRAPHATRPAPHWAAPAAGLASGVLATTTSAAGPPLVLLLLGRGHAPGRVRDTLTVTFAGLGLLSAAALAVTGTRGALPDPAALAALVPLAAVGQLAGRRVFAQLAAGSYEGVLTGVLIVSALGGLAAALV